MIETSAIILRTTRYRESSYIFDAFTEENGLVGFIVNGVRKKNAKISAAMLQIGSIVDLIAYPSKSSLSRTKELKSSYIYKSVPFNISKVSILNFVIEVFRKSVKESQVQKELYVFLLDFLINLDEEEKKLSLYPHSFMINLSEFFGLTPMIDLSNEYFDLHEGSSSNKIPEHQHFLNKNQMQLFELIKASSRQSLDDVKISTQERAEILTCLIYYYQYHIEGFGTLKSLDVVKELLNG